MTQTLFLKYLHLYFFIAPLDDINTIFLTNTCSEKEVERANFIIVA